MVNLGTVRIEIADAFSARFDYPLSQHRGLCAQVVFQDDPYRYHSIYASADPDARIDARHLAQTVATEINNR